MFPACSIGIDYGRVTTVLASNSVPAELQLGATTKATTVLAVSPGSTSNTPGRPGMSTGRAPSTLVVAE